MKKGRDSSQGGFRLEGFRTGGIHVRRDLGLEGYRKGGNGIQEGCGTGDILNKRSAGLMGCRKGGM